MTRNISTDAEINSVRLVQQTTAPSSPSSGHNLLYVVSGSAHGGLFLKDSSGRLIGPFITGSSSTSTPIMEQVYAYMASNNSDPIDTLITSGNYRVFIYLGSQNTSAWNGATNATYTVPAGKTLVVLQTIPTAFVAADPTNRRVRFQNTTDTITLVDYLDFYQSGFIWVGDLTTPSALTTVAAGKTSRLEIWNADSNKRAIGGIAICYEI